MIDKDSIIDYFNSEASSSRKAWEELMALPLKERIRKRKAIDGLKLVEHEKKYSPEGYVLLQFTYTRNLSDFKEGDALVLHIEKQKDGIPCNLYAYNDENVIVISVFPPNLTYSTEYLASKEWVLSKGFVDLRGSVYDKFYFRIPSEREAWENHLINQPTNPSLQNRNEVEAEVLDTEKKLANHSNREATRGHRECCGCRRLLSHSRASRDGQILRFGIDNDRRTSVCKA